MSGVHFDVARGAVARNPSTTGVAEDAGKACTRGGLSGAASRSDRRERGREVRRSRSDRRERCCDVRRSRSDRRERGREVRRRRSHRRQGRGEVRRRRSHRRQGRGEVRRRRSQRRQGHGEVGRRRSHGRQGHGDVRGRRSDRRQRRSDIRTRRSVRRQGAVMSEGDAPTEDGNFETTSYVYLHDEGVDVWRPVEVEPVGKAFRIIGRQPTSDGSSTPETSSVERPRCWRADRSSWPSPGWAE